MVSKAIMVSEKIKEQLDSMKSHPRDTYGDVVNMLITAHDKDFIIGVDTGIGKDQTVHHTPDEPFTELPAVARTPSIDSENQETPMPVDLHSEKISQENSEDPTLIDRTALADTTKDDSVELVGPEDK